MSDMLKALLDKAKEKGYIEEEKPVELENEYHFLDPNHPTGSFIGENVVFTGKLSMGRKEAQALVEKHGGNVSTSNTVTGSTTLVVCGERAGSKFNKAQKMGIPIIGENEFMKRVNSDGDDSGETIVGFTSDAISQVIRDRSKFQKQWIAEANQELKVLKK